jgi:hypothetical protein
MVLRRRRPVDDGRPRRDLQSGLCPCCHAQTWVDPEGRNRRCRTCGWSRLGPDHLCAVRRGRQHPPTLGPDPDALLVTYGACRAPVADHDGGAHRPCGAPLAEWSQAATDLGFGQRPDRDVLLHGLACTADPTHGPDRPPFPLEPMPLARPDPAVLTRPPLETHQ